MGSLPTVGEMAGKAFADAGYNGQYLIAGSTKMYHDLKEVYRRNDMKRNVADFVARCPNCQQVKAEHQRHVGTAEAVDMLSACVLDFKGSWDYHLSLIEFGYNNNYHASIQKAPFEAIYCKRCRAHIGWFEIREAELIGQDLVHQSMEKVKINKERLKNCLESLEVLLGRYNAVWDERGIEPQVYRTVQNHLEDWSGGYRLELPPEMSLVHPVLHVSMLKKVVGDSSLIVPVKAIEVNGELTYEEIPVAILDRQVGKLRNKEIASVKVLWQNQQVEEAT
ncbi:PREDICTED: uncharacterized protein LOC109238960 [Nicotiana attenuata]|uniref:uncharacterized protein LOC109238960 n=1 Tax=Nicotiana attenuata TaxID=49451 RepID=UPI000904F657|nr:PREDICTED: uncharacterized protein LOC109238960 [Nicotiana attenuata]